MLNRLCVPVLLACSLAFASTPLSVSGTVKSRRTGAAVSGASVHLVRAALSASTDADGRFSITGSLASQRRAGVRGALLEGSRGIAFHHDVDGPVDIRILDLSGKQQAAVHSGNLARGYWTVAPPSLPTGVYLCTFDGPEHRSSVPFFASGTSNGAKSGLVPVDAAEAAARTAAEPVDSLRVSKDGYKSLSVALDSYAKSGLEILLEDSSSVDVDAATIIPDPSWPCYMADGIPPPSLGTTAFSVILQIGAIHNVGLTKFGNRRQYDIKGGSIKGDKIDGTILKGGIDYELGLSTGSVEVEQINIIKVGSVPILMRNAGVAPAGAANARVVLDFEAPNSSSYAWLNTGKYVATRVVDTVARTIRLDVRDVSKATLPATRVEIEDPKDVPNQTWDCVKLSGGTGASLFTETVGLGSSISIGASKRGSRNIIPITGGTTSGRVVGKVLSGGADYQLSGLDARYTIQTNDGEFIIIRNCGSGQLVPVFEARVDGKYAFMNENKYLSSSPTVSGGSVSITFSEIK